MQAVLFHVGDDRYALDARCVAEIVPAIPLRRVPGSPDHVPGVLHYRGVVVPVVDLCRRLAGQACARLLSSRILICDAHGRAARAHGTHEPESLVGVLAERVLEVREVEVGGTGSHAGPATSLGAALGRIAGDEDGLLQTVEVGEILPPDLLHDLVRADTRATEDA